MENEVADVGPQSGVSRWHAGDMSYRGKPEWLLPAGAAAIALLSGWALANGNASALLLVAGGFALGVVAVARRGMCIALLALAAANGIPFLDTSRNLTHGVTLEDAASLCLFVFGVAWWAFGRGNDDITRPRRMLSWAGAALLAWWLVTVVRSVAGEQESLLRAVHFGRDFLYFGLALLVLPRVRLGGRDLRMLLGTLVIGAFVFAIGQILTSTGLSAVGDLIHYDRVAPTLGLTRLYSPMTDVVDAALAFCVAGVFLAERRRDRRISALLALVFLAAAALQLTRARWIGLLVGLLIVSVWLAIRAGSSTGPILRRRISMGIALLVVVATVAAIAAPQGVSSGPLASRALLTLSNIETGGGTLGVREQAAGVSLAYLGGKWPIGLGFLSPSSDYFAGLPDGSIRDGDLGVLNAVMTMGAIGAAILYVPVLIALRLCLRRGAWASPSYAALRYGGGVWLVAVMVSSLTLVTLFSVGGLILTAVLVTLLLQSPVVFTSAPAPATLLRDSEQARAVAHA